jgi:hypothetical protein
MFVARVAAGVADTVGRYFTAGLGSAYFLPAERRVAAITVTVSAAVAARTLSRRAAGSASIGGAASMAVRSRSGCFVTSWHGFLFLLRKLIFTFFILYFVMQL